VLKVIPSLRVFILWMNGWTRGKCPSALASEFVLLFYDLHDNDAIYIIQLKHNV